LFVFVQSRRQSVWDGGLIYDGLRRHSLERHSYGFAHRGSLE